MNFLLRVLAARLHAPRDCRGDRGSFTTEWMLGIVAVVAISGAVAAILIPAFTDAASSIDLGITK